jgi:F0F1-type ATP synthase assembly protein I
MNNLQLQHDLNADIDWAKVKEILSGIAVALEAVANMVPIGLIKNLLLGLAAGLNLIIGMLPNSSAQIHSSNAPVQ